MKKTISLAFFYIVMTQIAFGQANCQDSQISEFIPGTTITQNTLFGDPMAVQNGQTAIYTSSTLVNQHLMGFGALNPEPYTDQYDLTSLLERIGVNSGIVKDAETIVLTACCAPDWMKGGEQGDSFVLSIEDAPFPEHFDDYAELVAYVVQQPEFINVKYIQVWNELKGFYLEEENVWDSIGYTNLYNAVYNAVKDVRDDIMIGGPYVVLDSWANGFYKSNIGGAWGGYDWRSLQVLNYWLREKEGADFIVVDGHSSNKDGQPVGVDQWDMTDKFEDFMTWLRAHPHIDAQNLPVWWAEWYVHTDNPNASALETNALMTVALIKLVKSGVQTALLWSPQGDETGFISDVNTHQLALFNSTYEVGGGQTTLFYEVQRIIQDHFSVGASLIEVCSDNVNVDLLASTDKVLLVNKTNSNQSVTIGDISTTLTAYQALLIDTPDIVEPGPSESINCNYITNGDFEENTNGWTAEQCTIVVNEARCHVENIENVNNPWDAKLFFNDVKLNQGIEYTIRFSASSLQPRQMQIKIGQSQEPWATYFQTPISLTTSGQHFEHSFVMNTIASVRLELQVGGNTSDVFLDDVVIKESACEQDNACNLITNSDYELGAEDWAAWNCTTEINAAGQFEITPNFVASNAWDVAAASTHFQLFNGEIYDVQFQARSIGQPRDIKVKIGLNQPDWDNYFYRDIRLSTSLQTINHSFTMTDMNTAMGRIEFHLGLDSEAVIIDNILVKARTCINNNPCDLIEDGEFGADLLSWDFWRCQATIDSEQRFYIDQIEDMLDPWESVFAYPNLNLAGGNTYTLIFEGQSIINTRTIFVKIGLGVDPFLTYSWQQVDLLPSMNRFEYSFTMPQTGTNLGRLEFQVGGNTTAVILDNISIVDDSCQIIFTEQLPCPDILYVSGSVGNTMYQADIELISNGLISSGTDIRFYSGDNIVLDHEFTVEQSAVFVADIQPCQ